MASKTCSFNFFAIIFLFFVSLFPYHAFGSSRGFLLMNNTTMPPPMTRLCSTVTTHGYKCREYEVTTDDGYILSLQRIPHGLAGDNDTKLPPVLLQHGVLVDGMTWVINHPQQSLAMILADNGFDVWISNIRGTQFSRQHTTMNNTDEEYWNWTWDDLVIYDLPSVVGLIVNETGQKIHYIGHSMGTLIAMAAFSEGKLVDKVKSAAFLSPVAYISHMTTPIGFLAARTFLGEIGTTIGVAEFDPKGVVVANFLKAICVTPGLNCYDLTTAFTGKNCCLNETTIEFFLNNEPQPTSTKNLVHFSQTFRDGIVSKFDYGNDNVQHYGVSKPPIYELSKIPHDLPLFLSYGGQDALSDVQDVDILLDVLKFHDQDKLKVQFIQEYAHLDFIIGTNANDIVYNQIIEFFRRFS